MKLDEVLATVSEAMRENGVPADVITKTVREVRAVAEEEKAARDPKPRARMQTVIILPAPNPDNPEPPAAGWVVQMEDAAPVAAVMDRIRAAATSFNQSRAGRQSPVHSVAEVLEHVRGKHWKDEVRPEAKTKVITRSLVEIVNERPL